MFELYHVLIEVYWVSLNRSRQHERKGRLEQLSWNSVIETHWDSLDQPDVHP